MAKVFGQLCAAIARRRFFDDADLADEDIREAVAPEEDTGAFAEKLQLAAILVSHAVEENLDLSEVADFFENKGLSLSEEQQAGFAKFWKSYKPKITQALAQATAWNTQLQDVNWRVDVTTRTATQEEVNDTTAILELVLNNGDHVHCEADKAGVGLLKSELTRISAAIERARAASS